MDCHSKSATIHDGHLIVSLEPVRMRLADNREQHPLLFHRYYDDDGNCTQTHSHTHAHAHTEEIATRGKITRAQ